MRFRVRHAQQSIADHVEANLIALGWMNDPAPWGTQPVRVQEIQPEDAPDITPNLVSTLIEDAGADTEQEMGALVGGLMAVTYDVFIDVYGEKLSITWSIAEDVKDSITHRTIPLMDYTSSPAVDSGAQIEFEDVRIVKPLGTVQAADVKKNWRSVSAVATVYFQYEPPVAVAATYGSDTYGSDTYGG